MSKIDITKALELRVKRHMSYSEIGKYFGCTKQAVQNSLKRFVPLLLGAHELAAYKGQKADILESVEATLLNDLVDEDKRKKASLNNTAYALSAVSNMTRLEKGQSTSNVAYKDMSADLEELRMHRKQLEEALNEY